MAKAKTSKVLSNSAKAARAARIKAKKQAAKEQEKAKLRVEATKEVIDQILTEAHEAKVNRKAARAEMKRVLKDDGESLTTAQARLNLEEQRIEKLNKQLKAAKLKHKEAVKAEKAHETETTTTKTGKFKKTFTNPSTGNAVAGSSADASQEEPKKKKVLRRKLKDALPDPTPPKDSRTKVIEPTEGAITISHVEYDESLQLVDLDANQKNLLRKYRTWLYGGSKNNPGGDIVGFYGLWENGWVREEDVDRLHVIMGGRPWYIDIEDTEGNITKYPAHQDNWENIQKILLGKHIPVELLAESVTEDYLRQVIMRGITNIRFRIKPETVTVKVKGNPFAQEKKPKSEQSGAFMKRTLSTQVTAPLLIEYLQTLQTIVDPSDPYQLNIIDEPCLMYCLAMHGVPRHLILRVATALPNTAHVARSSLELVSEIVDRPISVHFYRDIDSNDTDCTVYNPDLPGKIIKLACFDSHYIVDEETPFTEYSITNVLKIQDQPNWNLITKCKTRSAAGGGVRQNYERTKTVGKISSLKLLKMLYKQDLLVVNPAMFKYAAEMAKFQIKDPTQFTHEGIEAEQRLFVPREPIRRVTGEKIVIPSDDGEDIEIPVGMKRRILAADIETTVKQVNVLGSVVSNKHVVYEIGWCVLEIEDKSGLTDEEIQKIIADRVNPNIVKTYKRSHENPARCVQAFLDDVMRDSPMDEYTIIYFHNVKYDFTVLTEFLNVIKLCVKDGNLYSVMIKHGGRTLELRDSYKLFAYPLSELPKEFGLVEGLRKQERIGYPYHTYENSVLNPVTKVSVREYAHYLPRKYGKNPTVGLIKILKENAEEFEYDEETNMFNPIKYYNYYLRFDCLVLRESLRVFAAIMEEVTRPEPTKDEPKPVGLDVFNYLTISSLAHAYMALNGAYEGCYELNGMTREYVAGAVYGGRCEVNAKYAGQKISKFFEKLKIAALDGVSLYPSAIKRLCEELGFPTGPCKAIPKELLKFEELSKASVFFIVTVKITAIKKKQQIPFVIYKTDSGCTTINEIPDEEMQKNGGLILTTDKISLEDWIKFQHIEFEILSGVMWNGETVKTMGKLIQNLFDCRKVSKEAKEQAKQLIFKLMMNSSYGKTITKKTKTRVRVVAGGYAERYEWSFFDKIQSHTALNDRQELFKLYDTDHSYNLGHIGVMILAYSKRIMNEVMDVANTPDDKTGEPICPVFYMDTDSQHVLLDKVPALAKEYKVQYGRELEGEDLGQFHNDFKLDGCVKGFSPYAIEAYYLWKKSYVEKVEGKNDKGEFIHEYHERMKGVTPDALEHKRDQFNGNSLEMYESLINNTQPFVMNPYENGAPSFQFNTGSVVTRPVGSFVRYIGFYYTEDARKAAHAKRLARLQATRQQDDDTTVTFEGIWNDTMFTIDDGIVKEDGGILTDLPEIYIDGKKYKKI